ncbi:hypothetical protein XENOCAPTIV_008485, partial [Xenoophorus captivus]
NWILDLFEELGDKELKYCQMLLQSTDKLKGGIKSMKRIPVEGGEKVDAADLMMQMYSSENREEVEKVLNELKESTEVEHLIYFSLVILPLEKGIRSMLLDFIKKVSNETLEQLLKALVADKVLTASEMKCVLEKNHTRVNKASCLKAGCRTDMTSKEAFQEVFWSSFNYAAKPSSRDGHIENENFYEVLNSACCLLPAQLCLDSWIEECVPEKQTFRFPSRCSSATSIILLSSSVYVSCSRDQALLHQRCSGSIGPTVGSVRRA